MWRSGQKTIYTLNVDNYAPEVLALTTPLLKQYASKIGADVYTITARRWPDRAPVYEKLQIYDLLYERGDEWAIYIDSDALVHPDMFDVTEHLRKDTVCHNGADMAGNRWRYDDYFRRDGRHIGSCNWFTVASRWCRDLWRPPDDLTYEEALENIFPSQTELQTIVTRDHLVDDYLLSRNIARFGLKFTTVNLMLKEMQDTGLYLWHQYLIPPAEKVRQMRVILRQWDVMPPAPVSVEGALRIEGWMTAEELGWLATEALARRRIVEVGSHLGRSTLALAENTPGTVLAIDDWRGPRDVAVDARRDLFKEFTRNTAHCKNVRPLRLDHARLGEVALAEPPDMILIDGDHAYASVKRDVAWAASVADERTLICGHDIERPEVRRAVRGVLTGYHVLTGTGLLWWAERKR